MSDANVVARWRDRTLALGRQGWRCEACARVALVRRRRCVACGAGAFTRGALPERGVVVAMSAAGASVEHLDQVTGKRAVVWVELAGGGQLACLLGHSDTVSLMTAVRGQPVRLAVRRMGLGEVHGAGPIAYGTKAVLELETRATMKSTSEAAKVAPDPKES